MRSRTLLIVAAGLALTLALYALAGFVLLPRLVMGKAPQLLQDSGHRLRLGDFRFNPFTLTAHASDFAIEDAQGQPVASIAQATVDLEWRSIVAFAPVLSQVRVVKPALHVRIDADGQVNLAALAGHQAAATTAPESKTRSQDALPRFRIDSVAFEDGLITFTDQRESYSNRFEQLSLSLHSVSSMKSEKGTYALNARTANGAKLSWQGEMALQSLSASGKLEISELQLPTLMPYLDAQLAGRITSGHAELTLPHRFEIRDGRPQVTLDGASATLSDFALALPDAGADVPAAVKLQGLTLGGLALDLQKRQLSVQQLGLSGLAVAAQRNAQGRLDLETLLVKRPPDDPPSEPWSVSIEHTELKKASVAFADAGTRLSLGLQDIHARVDKLSTDPATPLSFELKAALRDSKGSISARGEATPATAAFKAQVELAAIPLALAQPLVEAQARVRIASGEARLSGELQQNDKTPLRFAGDAAISDVNLQRSGDAARPLMTLKRFALQGIALDVAGQQVAVQQARIAGLGLEVQRDADGRLDLQDLRVPATTPAVAAGAAATSTAVTAPSASPWTARIASVELSDSSLSLADAGLHMSLGLDDITARAGNLSTDIARPVTFEVKAGLRGSKGSISARGQATPASGALTARIEAGAIPLSLFQPVIEAHTQARIATGTASAAGELQLGGKEAFRYTGRVSLDELAMDEAAAKPVSGQAAGSGILGWKSLVTDNLSISGMPLRINMDELRLVAPRGRLAIAPDNSINVKRAFSAPVMPPAVNTEVSTQQAPADTHAAPDPDTGISLDLRRLRVTQGELQFSDDSLSSGFTTQIHGLEGVFSELSSDRNTRSEFSLEGGVDEFGFARLSGALNPFQLRDRTSLRVEFRNLDLTRASPYAIKFAGYRIASGRLSLDLRYTVRNSVIEGQNSALLDQLELGERVDSPTALNLPISLAISLLKDSDGRIDISVPISGNLDDPKFDYSALIWRAIGNLISGIVTAPFRALASLFGGSNQADAVKVISFEPGQSRLLPPEREKLQRVAGALAKRPELKLLVPGRVDTSSDSERLKRAALSRDIARRAGFDVAEDNSAGGLSIQDKRTRDAIRALYAERFGAAALNKLKTEAEVEATKANAAKPGMLDKLRNFAAGEPQLADARPFYATLMRQLREAEQLPPDALQQLAQARSASIITMLAQAGVAAGRMQASVAAATEGDPQAREVKVELELATR